MLKYRKIKADDDEVLAGIIRANLETLHLNIPGTDRHTGKAGQGTLEHGRLCCLCRAGVKYVSNGCEQYRKL